MFSIYLPLLWKPYVTHTVSLGYLWCDIWLLLRNMSRTRKYRFTLCFRVLNSQFIKRSVYANVFKFIKEKKGFERAKVNTRCFHRSQAAMLVSLRESSGGHQDGVSIIPSAIILSGTLCRITRVRNIALSWNFDTLFKFYFSTISQFLDLIRWMVTKVISFFICVILACGRANQELLSKSIYLSLLRFQMFIFLRLCCLSNCRSIRELHKGIFCLKIW